MQSRGRAVPRARARHEMGAQKRVVMGSRGAPTGACERAALPGPLPRAPSARARTHQGHCANAWAGRAKRGRGGAMLLGSFGRMWPSSPRGRAKAIARGMRARHKRGAAAPCYFVASAECGQPHPVGAPRPSHGRARRAGAVAW
ncbi:hypothetical protein PIB30_065887 [Stylosanthes scabra]|uniref:Uncharacterized protein n=1 Tax=Stylosanthes scabra TaxID=79078 RepID=A0ABU6WM53_9FABA|nr:hypothetical protein [Stylosanthes scabra]